MDYRKCNSCGLSNLVTESVCFRCGGILGYETRSDVAATVLGTAPVTPVRETNPAQLLNCPSCGSRVSNMATRCQYCNGDLVPAQSAGFYRARLVPDSDFRRAQHGEQDVAETGIRNTSVTVFAVFNLVFAILTFGGVAFWLLMVFNGLFGSDPKAREAVGGFVIFLVPNLISFLLFLPAAIGLMKRRTWGYYAHLAAAVLAGFSCIGLLYTVPALIMAFRPEFKNDFRDQ